MEDRNTSEGFVRPYVLNGDEDHATQAPRPRPAEDTSGAHRRPETPADGTAQDSSALRLSPTALASAVVPVAAAGRPVAAPIGAVRLIGDWGRATAARRNGIIASFVFLSVAAVVLVVIVTSEKSTERQPSVPLAGPSDTAEWLLPNGGQIDSPGPVPPTAGRPPVLSLGDDTSGPGAPGPADQVPPGPVAPTRPGAPTATPAPKKTSRPAPPVQQNATAYTTIQGESFDGQSGVKSEADETGGGWHIGFISTGDWVRYDDIGFTDQPAHTLVLSASNAARQNRVGKVELRLDRGSGAPVASMTIPNNGDWFAFQTYSLTIPPTTGVHTVYLTFTSTQNEEFANVDWLTFKH